MRKQTRVPFSMDRNFRAARPFVLFGKKYGVNDPVSKDGLTTNRLEQMFDNRMIEVAPAAEQSGSVASKKPAASVPDATNTAAPNAAPAASQTNAGALRAEHRGFGRWFVVDASGADVAGPLKREEAQKRAGE